ncbi:hypothetical protein LCGC14_1558190 [marine sediment metagenome]|uniref:Uncharacterized protein n=1 Tax=marine sediment metagenome TaxID=412755 RepID=A0A0F9J9C2_9ZZZZ
MSDRMKATRDIHLPCEGRSTMMCIPEGAECDVLFVAVFPDGSRAAYVDGGAWSGYVPEDAVRLA